MSITFWYFNLALTKLKNVSKAIPCLLNITCHASTPTLQVEESWTLNACCKIKETQYSDSFLAWSSYRCAVIHLNDQAQYSKQYYLHMKEFINSIPDCKDCSYKRAPMLDENLWYISKIQCPMQLWTIQPFPVFGTKLKNKEHFCWFSSSFFILIKGSFLLSVDHILVTAIQSYLGFTPTELLHSFQPLFFEKIEWWQIHGNNY